MPLPAPLTPQGCDLRDFPFMPLHVHRLRDSEFAATFDAEACWYGVLLWCASWHQVPAGSLPNDDRTLARMCGLGKDVTTFQLHRAGALHGFIECRDGRLYHPVVAEQALNAWKAKLEQRWRTECARIKKHNQRHGTEYETPTLEDFLAEGCPVKPLSTKGNSPRPDAVPEDSPTLSLGTGQGQDRDVPRETASKREGEREGQGEGERDSNNIDCLIGARERADDEDDDGEGPADAALRAVASAAGFNLTDDNRDRSRAIVKGWLDAGMDLDATILPTIRDALPKLDGPTSSLTRFSRSMQHAHAKRQAAPPPPTDATPLLFEFDDEPPEMANLRRDVAEAIGPDTYRAFASRFRLEPVPEQAALRIRSKGAAHVFDGTRTGPIRRAAAKHGFADVWRE